MDDSWEIKVNSKACPFHEYEGCYHPRHEERYIIPDCSGNTCPIKMRDNVSDWEVKTNRKYCPYTHRIRGGCFHPIHDCSPASCVDSSYNPCPIKV